MKVLFFLLKRRLLKLVLGHGRVHDLNGDLSLPVDVSASVLKKLIDIGGRFLVFKSFLQYALLSGTPERGLHPFIGAFFPYK